MLKSRLECSIISSNWITPKEKISRILIGSINNHYPKDKFHSFSNYCKPEAIERCYPEEITLNKKKKLKRDSLELIQMICFVPNHIKRVIIIMCIQEFGCKITWWAVS